MAINSPLVNTHRDIEPLDLILAVQICSERTFGKLTWLDHWYLHKLSRNKEFFQQVVVQFTDYALQPIWPKFWEKKDISDGSATGGVPWPLIIIANLISNGISEDRAWNMPECQAVWMSTAFVKIKGGEVNILTTEEEEFMEQERQSKSKSETSVA